MEGVHPYDFDDGLKQNRQYTQDSCDDDPQYLETYVNIKNPSEEKLSFSFSNTGSIHTRLDMKLGDSTFQLYPSNLVQFREGKMKSEGVTTTDFYELDFNEKIAYLKKNGDNNDNYFKIRIDEYPTKLEFRGHYDVMRGFRIQ